MSKTFSLGCRSCSLSLDVRLFVLAGIAVCVSLLTACPPPSVKRTTLLAPQGVSTEALSSTSIRVNWQFVADAEAYNVYRSSTETGTFMQINGSAVPLPPYDDTGLTPNTTYWYKVVALWHSEEQTVSSPFSGSTRLEIPGSVAVRAALEGELLVSWNPIGGAEGYNVYRSDSASGWFSKLNAAAVTGTSYADSGLGAGVTYWYKVVALKGGVENDISDPVGGTTLLAAPANAAVSYLSGTSLRVTWDAVTGADAYNVYRGDTKTGLFSKLNTTPTASTTHDDAGLTADTVYWYRVVAAIAGVEQVACTAVRGVTAPLWVKTYGGPEDDRAWSIQQTSDGGYIVAGSADSFGYYHGTAWVIKLEASGAVSWQKRYEGCRVSYAVAREATGGGYYVGARMLDSWSTYDFAILKLDAWGSISWQTRYGGGTGSLDTLCCLAETSDGGCLVAGDTAYRTIHILKVDSGGGTTWSKSFNTVQMQTFARAVDQTADGGYVVAGSTTVYGQGGSDVWVIKLDSAGTVLWQKTYGTSGNDSASDVKATADGGCIVSGYLNNEVALIRLDSSGGISWQKTYSGLGNWDYARYSVEVTADGGYVLTSYTSSVGNGLYEIWIAKLDSTGDITWQRAYGGSGTDQPSSIGQTSDGGYILSGTTTSFGAGGEDYWALRLPASGALRTAEIMTDTSIAAQDGTAAALDTSVVPGSSGLGVGYPVSTVTDTNATVRTQYP